ncbi:glycosyltransferase [Geobacter sp. AOG1]|uniref:glycosyltransferase n=1 Tax=Geobacter sp. AOG1 TaxID=1566346 RepID=UPI001CC4E972|nr:glycosyltransferase [Geobacter sp. AOG1]GFE58638.1 hypothetical protein AOG1_25180 [Geobacter sp. AOG1]
MNVLFVTWDGPQVTYLESLFLPIFKRLAKSGINFHILQFTWGDAQRVKIIRQACIDADFTYQAETIWRHPVAAGGLLTALNGARLIRKSVHDHRIDAVMPRSTLPALATLLALHGRSLPMIFDADGLPLDERVDFSGQSSSGLFYRLLRDIESQAVRRADVVLTRSRKAVEILRARAGAGTAFDKYHVVSNGRDSKVFKPADSVEYSDMRKKCNVNLHAPFVIYSGSLGGKYCLTEMLHLFSFIRMRRGDAKFLILTGTPDIANNIINQFPHLKESVNTLAVSSNMVSQYLSCADLGLSLIRPSYSMQGAAAIKTGEYLLSGLPIVATPGIGDSKEISSEVGYLLENMGERDLKAAANWFIDVVLPNREAFRTNCRGIGETNYSLDASTNAYVDALLRVNK